MPQIMETEDEDELRLIGVQDTDDTNNDVNLSPAGVQEMAMDHVVDLSVNNVTDYTDGIIIRQQSDMASGSDDQSSRLDIDIHSPRREV
ncbi:hypothetical protein Btru_008409 [Bulinus truncatus]|nr:hypothetical protein Btru_008409 [Bulinus truncatus]